MLNPRISKKTVAKLNTFDVISPTETFRIFRIVGEFSHMSFNRLSSLASLFCKVFLDLEVKLNLCTCCIIFDVDLQPETIEAFINMWRTQ